MSILISNQPPATMKCICLLLLIILLTNITQAQTFAWAYGMGDTQGDRGNAVAVNNAGHVFTTGQFRGTVDFNPGAGVFNLTAPPTFVDFFLQKLDASGNFIWAKKLDGDSLSAGFEIAIDQSSNIYIVGAFRGTKDFDPGAGIFNLTASGLNDVFVLKLDSDGNFIWARKFGGLSSEIGYHIKVDHAGDICLNGVFQGTVDFDPGPAVYNLTSGVASPGNNSFIVKLDAAGNFQWAKQFFSATSQNQAGGLVFDTFNNVYLSGAFTNTVDFDPGISAYNLSALGSNDLYIEKLDASGNFISVTRIGANVGAAGGVPGIDANNNLYVAGYFYAAPTSPMDFDPGPGVFNLSTNFPGVDGFLLKLNSNGDFVFVKQLVATPSGWCSTLSVSLDPAGNIYTIGFMDLMVDFDPGPGTYILTSSGGRDIFVSKFDPSGNITWAGLMGGAAGDDYGNGIAVNGNSIYTTGYFIGSADFDPGTGVSTLISNGSEDIFIQKLTQGACALPAQPSSISGVNTVCQGSSQTYTINAVPGATSYSWTLPTGGGWAGSSTSNSITVTVGSSSGNILVSANNNCGSSSPQTLAVNVNPVPAQPGIISGNSSVCQGSSQTYSVSAVPGATGYLWSLPSGWSGTSLTNSITTNVGTTNGDISVTANNSCGNSIARTLAVTTNPPPLQPGSIAGNVSVNTNQTSSYSINSVNGATGYNWTLSGGGTISTGQNSSSITITWTTAGNHTLSVNATNGCGTSANQTLNITVSIITSVVNPDNQYQILVTPNPSYGEFYLRAKGVVNKKVEINISDMNGQRIQHYRQIANNNDHIQLLDMKRFAAGTYHVEVVIGNKTYSRTIVKIN